MGNSLSSNKRSDNVDPIVWVTLQPLMHVCLSNVIPCVYHISHFMEETHSLKNCRHEYITRALHVDL